MSRISARPVLLGIVLAVVMTLPAVADVAMEGIAPQALFPGAKFDPAIPTQQELLGFHPGARPMRHAELLRYLNALADASPRVRIVEYARTHEGRPMVYVAVGPPELIADLDAFQAEHAARLDPRNHAAGQDASKTADTRAVAWMAYGIHGDELSSVDAAAAVAYWLVAGEDEQTAKIRSELLVLIDPAENPDGRDRYLAQTNAFAHAVPNPDQEDLSHTAIWPWGRGNHYLFDLNRDWFSMVHPESTRSTVIASWNPQLVVDSHEMGDNSSYLFTPPRHPFNPHLPPGQHKWWKRFAADQAEALDSRGYPYFTREWNEEFFPGYGSSWAAYHGALGILYEMSGTGGTLVRKREGSLRTYAQATEHQVASSVANLTTLADNRAEILGDFIADRRAFMEAKGNVAAWILPEGRHPERTRRLVKLLTRQGIEVWRSNVTPPQVDGMRDILSAEQVAASSIKGDAWMVPIDQPAGRLVRELLDPHVPMEANFFREEREYLELGKGTRLYEVTAWSLALAYGVEAHWTTSRPRDEWSRETPEPLRGAMHAADQAVAWVIDGDSDNAAPALASLLQQGVRVKVAEKAFRVGDRGWGAGALVIPAEDNPSDLESRLTSLSEQHAIDVRALSTGKADHGPDLGGSHFLPLIAPRVGIWTGPMISSVAYGHLWHLFDKEIEMRFSALDLLGFASTDLDRYNVLIFPPAGRSGGYASVLGEKGLARLQQWIQAGGTAIGIGSGAAFLADKKSGLTATRLRRQALDKYPPVVIGPSLKEARKGGPYQATGLRAPEGLQVAEITAKGEVRKKKTPPPISRRDSPYDVAPMLGQAAKYFAAGTDQGTPVVERPVDLADWVKPLLPPGQKQAEAEDLKRADARLRRFSPRGAFLRIELDPEVWMSWGLSAEMPALVRQSDTLVAATPVQVAARFADLDRLHLGGLLWPEAGGRLSRTAYATRESNEKGQVILFLSEPEFRGWTLGTRRLLLNSILLGPGVGTDWSTPW